MATIARTAEFLDLTIRLEQHDHDHMFRISAVADDDTEAFGTDWFITANDADTAFDFVETMAAAYHG